MKTLKNLTSLLGRTVTKIDLNQFNDGKGGTAFDPVIYFDDGQSLCFVVQETDIGEYGIDPVLIPPTAVQRKKAKGRK